MTAITEIQNLTDEELRSNAAVYIDNLCKITESDYYSLLKPHVVRATARQRRQALLLSRSNPDSCQADKKVVAKSD